MNFIYFRLPISHLNFLTCYMYLLTAVTLTLSSIQANVHRNIAMTSQHKYYLSDESHRFSWKLITLGDITLGLVWDNLELQLMSSIYDAGL